jgi:hypothetical protein
MLMLKSTHNGVVGAMSDAIAMLRAQLKASQQEASICAEGADTLKEALDKLTAEREAEHREFRAIIAERDELKRRLSRPKPKTARAVGAAKKKG